MDEDSTTVDVSSDADGPNDPMMDDGEPEEGTAQEGIYGNERSETVAESKEVAAINPHNGDDRRYDPLLSDLFLDVMEKHEAPRKDDATKKTNTEISIELAKKYALAREESAEESAEALYREFYVYMSTVLIAFSVPPDKGKFLRKHLMTALEEYEKKREQQKGHGSSSERQASFASIAFEIKDSDLTHSFDLEAFGEKVINVHDAFYGNGNKLGYIGPYFPFVQSSGMGKTKILFEYKKHCSNMNKKGYKMEAKLVLCRDITTDDVDRREKEKEIFDIFFSFNNIASGQSSANAVLDEMFEKFDGIFIKKEDKILRQGGKKKILVLMFDEAHYLLGTRTINDKTTEAFLFRAIRIWICSKFDSTNVVAVFAGTNTKIGNFEVESDKFPSNERKTDTREYAYRSFYPRGNKSFEPFFQTTTIGCLRNRHTSKRRHNTANAPLSDYELAIPYGRPLFSLMHHNNDRLSAGMDTIVRRMLIDHHQWETSVSSWISILGTRVQMGQTSFPIASDMVGSAYANLVDVDHSGDETAKITFMPDPVCARLAMCLMDEDWQMETANVRGKSKRWWSEKVSEVFSNGICTPEKGDVGEIMAALYLLFSADILRKQLDGDYKTFSVPVASWMALLVEGGGRHRSVPSVENNSKQDPKKKKRDLEAVEEEPEQVNKKSKQSCKESKQVEDHTSKKDTITFSAIQVCRNNLRAYGKSWKDLKDQEFLKGLYEVGIGFYVFARCEMIDLVFALKKTDSKGEIVYFPMVVSVKCHATYTAHSAETECDKMLTRAEEAGGCFLCLLVVLGAEGVQNDGKYTLVDSCVDKLINNESVAAVLRVPADDQFGLSNAFRGCTSLKQEESEIFASHFFLGTHRTKERDLEAFATAVLRSSPKKSLMTKTQRLHKPLIEQK